MKEPIASPIDAKIENWICDKLYDNGCIITENDLFVSTYNKTDNAKAEGRAKKAVGFYKGYSMETRWVVGDSILTCVISGYNAKVPKEICLALMADLKAIKGKTCNFVNFDEGYQYTISSAFYEQNAKLTIGIMEFVVNVDKK